MNRNRKSENSEKLCCPKGLGKMNISPKRLITLKISDMKPENLLF